MTATMTTIVTSAELHGAGSSLSQRPLNPAPTSAPIQKQPLKPAVTTAPRIDVEPIYTALKSLIGEHWQIYKTSVAEFVLGMRPESCAMLF
jgi:transcriptional coactivator HFI1/ADA1